MICNSRLMEPTFTKEQRLLHQVVLHANDVPARGLFDGQMGIVLVLAEYARARRLRLQSLEVSILPPDQRVVSSE